MPDFIYLFAALFFLLLIRSRLRPSAIAVRRQPESPANSEEREQISAGYVRKLNLLTICFAILSIPLYILPAYITDYLFFPLLCLFLWLILLICFFNKARSTYVRNLAAINGNVQKESRKVPFVHIAGYTLAGLLMAYALLIAYRGEFTEPQITVATDLVTIETPGHTCRFAPRDILNIATTETIPSCEKVDAFHSNRITYGLFKLEDGFPAELYLHLKNKPYIFIRLEHKIIMFNGKTPEETAGYLDRLSKARRPSPPVQACNPGISR